MKYISPLFASASGTLGGAVASKARGGINYLRARIIPTNPSTLLQSAIRSAVQSASAVWQSILTELQQESWWDIASGSQTGKSLFTQVNQPRIYAANTGRVVDDLGAPHVLVPAYFPSAPASGITVDFIPAAAPVIDDSANTLQLADVDSGNWNLGADATHNPVIFVYLSGPQNASRFSRQHSYQLVQAYTTELATGTISFPAVNLAALGIPTVAGKIFYVKIYAQDAAGRTSLPVEYRVTVVA